MNSPENFYREKLYPFQDGILNIVKASGAPFYQTGGTALSRGCLNFRYSDGLDLFVKQIIEGLIGGKDNELCRH